MGDTCHKIAVEVEEMNAITMHVVIIASGVFTIDGEVDYSRGHYSPLHTQLMMTVLM